MQIGNREHSRSGSGLIFFVPAGRFNKTTTEVHEWDERQLKFTPRGTIGLDPSSSAPPLVYHLSGHVAQSNCWGLCGSMGRDGAFGWRLERPTAAATGRSQQQQLQQQAVTWEASEDSTDPEARLTCLMPKNYASEILFVHQNCLSDLAVKSARLRMFSRMRVDEVQFNASAEAHNVSVWPAWPLSSQVSATTL